MEVELPSPSRVSYFSPACPQQENFFDCGLFLLEYAAWIIWRPKSLLKICDEGKHDFFSENKRFRQKKISSRKKSLVKILRENISPHLGSSSSLNLERKWECDPESAFDLARKLGLVGAPSKVRIERKEADEN